MGAKLNAFANSCDRIMLNIKRLDRVSNGKIYDLTGTSPLPSTVISRQVKFVGDVLRMGKGEPTKIYELFESSHGKRPSERPRRSFSGHVEEWIDTEELLLRR